MVNNNTDMKSGRCIECGARETDGFSCYELYELHFWLVSCYMIQHPSNYTEEGYKHLVNLFIDAYDNNWDTPYILKKNREIVKSIGKITNPIPNEERKRELRLWSMTIEDIYLGGEQNAIKNIKKWKERVRNDLR
jgi:hypothetical protein